MYIKPYFFLLLLFILINKCISTSTTFTITRDSVLDSYTITKNNNVLYDDLIVKKSSTKYHLKDYALNTSDIYDTSSNPTESFINTTYPSFINSYLDQINYNTTYNVVYQEHYPSGYIKAVTNDLYRIDLNHENPNSIYINQYFQCDKIYLHSSNSFNCTNEVNDTISFNYIDNSNERSYNLIVDQNLLASNYTFISLAINRLETISNYQDSILLIKDSNNKRTSLNKQMVAPLWTLAALSMVFISGMSSILQIWCCTSSKYKQSKYIWMLWLIFIILTSIISYTLGLAGFFLMGIIFFLYNFISYFIYCKHYGCCFNKIREKVQPLKQLDITTTNEGLNKEDDINTTTVRNSKSILSTCPNRFDQTSKKHYQIYSILFYLCIISWLLIFMFWSVKPYVLINRYAGRNNADFKNAIIIEEYIPQMIAKGVAAMYVYKGYAQSLKMNNFFDLSTHYCGIFYNKQLKNQAEKKEAIYNAFIKKYNIDMSIYNRSNYDEYNSVNDWFTRTLKDSIRPIYQINNTNIVNSAADARVIVFPSVPNDQRFWIKENHFNIEDLISTELYHEKFSDNVPLVIFRLSPQDYHRFHAPSDGIIEHIKVIKGGLHSVNFDGITSGNNAIYNTRTIVIINTINHGKIAYIAIGATCVGSVVIIPKVNDYINKGDEIGYFQFGGSTIVLLFENDVNFKFDDDLITSSNNQVETLIQVNTKIGIITLIKINMSFFFFLFYYNLFCDAG